MIYFDAGATTLQKPETGWAPATTGRRAAILAGAGELSGQRGRRRKQTCNAAHWQQSCLAWLIRAVFTSCATHGLNIAVHTLVKPVRTGGRLGI